MSTVVQLEQSSREEKIFPLNYAPGLLAGVTVSSVAVLHTPPSGGVLIVTPSVVGDVAYVPIPKGLAIGVNKFSCVATTSNSELSPEILLIITVMR